MVAKKILMIDTVIVCLVAMLGVSDCLAQSAMDRDVSLDALAKRMAQLEDRINHLQLRREKLGEIVEGVNFAIGSDSLNPAAQRLIDELVRNTSGYQDTHFFVAGYTDSSGSAKLNYELGMRRASQVARYLIEHDHIDPSHVTTGSHGRADAFASNRGTLGRSLNRHVEIIAYRWVIR